MKRLPAIGTLGPLLALLIACVIFATQSDRFLSSENFALILQQVMVVGVIAIGQTLIILTAGIDLSCGMVMALGSIVMTKFAADFGLPGGLFRSLWARRSAQPPCHAGASARRRVRGPFGSAGGAYFLPQHSSVPVLTSLLSTPATALAAISVTPVSV